MLHDLALELRRENETLREEIHQLRDTIHILTGGADIVSSRVQFHLTDIEARFFIPMVRTGCITQDQIGAIYENFGLFHNVENFSQSFRSHAKRIRAKTRPHGVDFETQYGLGFVMEAGDRKRAAAIIARGTET